MCVCVCVCVCVCMRQVLLWTSHIGGALIVAGLCATVLVPSSQARGGAANHAVGSQGDPIGGIETLATNGTGACKGTRRSSAPPMSPMCNEATAGCAVFGTLLFYVVVFHTLSNMPLNEQLLVGIQARFWMQPNSILFIYFGMGLNFILLVVCRRMLLLNGVQGCPKRAASALTALAFIGLSAALGASQVHGWHSHIDQSANIYMSNYGRAVIEAVPTGSIVVSNYDMQWAAIRYLRECEMIRPYPYLLFVHIRWE